MYLVTDVGLTVAHSTSCGQVLYSHFLATVKLGSQSKPHWWPTAIDWDKVSKTILSMSSSSKVRK